MFSMDFESTTESETNKYLNRQSKIVEMNALKQELSTYDYIGIKIATGVATIEEYKDKISYCEILRQKIRKLEDSTNQEK